MSDYSIFQSLGFAAKGLVKMVKKERNFKIHLTAAAGITVIGLFLSFTYLEWLVISLLIAVILAAELLNTAIEGLCNLMKEKLHLAYEDTTDIRNYAAASAFVIALFSLLIGIILIINKLQ